MFFHFFNHQILINLQCQTWFFMLHVWPKANSEGFLWSHQGKTEASISERIGTPVSDFGVFALQVGL